MTLADLKEIVEEYEDMPDDTEVRIMSQKNWPFENSIRGAVRASDMYEEEEYIDEDEEDQDKAEKVRHVAYKPVKGEMDRRQLEDAIYLVEGRQIGYGTKTAWDYV